MFKMQAMTTMAVLLLICGQTAFAANVERQRRVQTTATATSSAGIAGELARLGLPLRHATYETNDEFYETSSKSLVKPHPEPLPVAVPVPVQVASEPEYKVFDLLSGGELSVGQVRHLLQLNAQAEPAQQLRLQVPQNEARVFFGLRPQAPGNGNGTAITNVINNTVTVSPASTSTTPSTTTTTRLAPQLLPLSYYQNRQVSPFGGLSYGLIDPSSLGYAGNQVPLVPISLGNNAVGYVPMNLRMFRQLIDGNANNVAEPTVGFTSVGSLSSPFTFSSTFSTLPIRESEEAAAAAVNPLESVVDNDAELADDAAEESAAPASAAAVANEKATFPNRLQLFGQNLRQLPVLTFAKNLRRVQVV
ncbi:hypothetical protein KR215_005326 [Drosophila sulfurigaster]|nr:hypothetical protein KR215_005326 [Drosophila sulfurigaster]